MSKKEICRAVKRDGKRCANAAKVAGFCAIHYPKPKGDAWKAVGDRVETVGKVIAVAGGAVTLVETILKVWQSLPFGAAPQMSQDYEYLSEQLGPQYPSLLKEYAPFSKGASSVDWTKARELYDYSHEVLLAAESPEFNMDVDTFGIEARVGIVLDTMQPQMLEIVSRQLGEVEEAEGSQFL